MLAGISSAFGAVFGSPLAGAFFGMEMCFIGKIDYTAGIYCLVASFTGYFTSLALGTEYEANVIASVPAMTPKTVIIVVISAIIFGLTARLLPGLFEPSKACTVALSLITSSAHS